MVKKLTSENNECFTVKSIVAIYQNIIIAQQILNIDSKAALESASSIFMRGTSNKNEEVKLFRFFDSNINSNLLLSPT